MKIILSRKGFDIKNGGCPSPIMPDGTLLSMPIPSDDDASYDDLCYNGERYSYILKQLKPHKNFTNCHIDPDIRDDNRVSPIAGWRPAFGQSEAAQGLLSNAGVEKGDIFLFFGWFRRIEKHNGSYRFISRKTGGFYDHNDLQIIYGYMQIGDILTEKVDFSEYPWHPHTSNAFSHTGKNALYIPTDKLSLLPDLKGYGTLDYRKDRVLTMEGKNRGTWNELPFLLPEHTYGEKKNSSKGEGLYYRGIWQELVIYESAGLTEWVRSVIKR
ncbi:MAG: hypothetical protein IJT87_06000 [Ruminiclostridium sp.]|nr:hypothetical protein [Ruminiclostridium sp.]